MNDGLILCVTHMLKHQHVPLANLNLAHNINNLSRSISQDDMIATSSFHSQYSTLQNLNACFQFHLRILIKVYLKLYLIAFSDYLLLPSFGKVCPPDCLHQYECQEKNYTDGIYRLLY